MKIRFLRSVTVATDEHPGGEHIEPGDEFEMADDRAAYYVKAGAARALDGPLAQSVGQAGSKDESAAKTGTKRLKGGKATRNTPNG